MVSHIQEQPKILIADDEVSARDTLEGLLDQESYSLYFAANGRELLTCLEANEPDVILLDVMMPGMDGYEICQYLKADKHWQHIPIILITALNSKEEMVRGLDAGADEFISKPVEGLELRSRVRSMLRIKQQYDQLKATMQLREDLAHMLVHDMRVPLTAIMGYTSLLLMFENELPPKTLDKIERINRQAGRLHTFVDDLLAMAKMEQGELILNRSRINIIPLLQEVERDHRSMASLKQVDFIVDLPETMEGQSWLDATLLQRVVDNLLSNAFKFSSAGDTVKLCVEYLQRNEDVSGSKPTLRIKVFDQGPGISDDDRERIFDKFEVVALRRANISQVGLGLAFCKFVVEAHRGQIWVEANQPRGSVFIVEI